MCVIPSELNLQLEAQGSVRFHVHLVQEGLTLEGPESWCLADPGAIADTHYEVTMLVHLSLNTKVKKTSDIPDLELAA